MDNLIYTMAAGLFFSLVFLFQFYRHCENNPDPLIDDLDEIYKTAHQFEKEVASKKYRG